MAWSDPRDSAVNLFVNASNTEVIHLYQALGFEEFGCEPGAPFINGELHDEIHMRLVLNGG